MSQALSANEEPEFMLSHGIDIMFGQLSLILIPYSGSQQWPFDGS